MLPSRLFLVGPKTGTRSLAYVSNKRITRVQSDLEVDQSEIGTTGNEKYINVRLANRNPRNLEQMLMEPKPMGFEMDSPSRHFWNKVVFENRSRFLLGKIVHHSGRTVVKAATNEPSIAAFLTNLNDVRAAAILGQVLAMRALESGFHSVHCEHEPKSSHSEKSNSFFAALAENGLNLDEQSFIVDRQQRDQ